MLVSWPRCSQAGVESLLEPGDIKLPHMHYGDDGAVGLLLDGTQLLIISLRTVRTIGHDTSGRRTMIVEFELDDQYRAGFVAMVTFSNVEIVTDMRDVWNSRR